MTQYKPKHNESTISVFDKRPKNDTSYDFRSIEVHIRIRNEEFAFSNLFLII